MKRPYLREHASLPNNRQIPNALARSSRRFVSERGGRHQSAQHSREISNRFGRQRQSLLVASCA
ncbi:hypothetical protein AB395_00002179 [Sinorhizobium fredii CCBAU 45436]|nr:hypothetical protein SF83666_c21700 [Sinorhizobium fredii CCBAU 83666]AWI57832.1 hypothetical protein AB395_00002179 [Sinorhizobium fredii CCBAU 45436]AWM25678.1 hypothetical protein AOX55_00002427 [Sinorhizobium fredii CCBAU 25509]